jgi:hypothetical protein
MATREELISGLEMLIREGRRLATDLGPQQWDRVVDLDGWKNQEVLAHVASIGSLVPQMAGGFTTAGAGNDAMASIDIDQLNAAMVAQRAGKSATELADELETAYAGVIKFVKDAPEDLLTTRVTAGGHKDIPMSDILNRMVVLHGLGHVYSVYSSVFFAK